jgi:hypothetical protein
VNAPLKNEPALAKFDSEEVVVNVLDVFRLLEFSVVGSSRHHERVNKGSRMK